MPRFSSFTRFGHLRFSHAKSHGEKIYDAIVQLLGKEENFDLTDGTVVAGFWYAVAMRLANAKYVGERAAMQFNPLKAFELLPALEWEFSISPSPTATIAQRRASVAVAAKIARGAKRSNVEDVLRTELGSDFLAYIPMPYADAYVSSSDPASVGVWNRPGSSKSVYRLTGPIAQLGVLKSVPMEFVAGDASPLQIFQRVMLDLEHSARSESVTVLGGGSTSIAGVFTKPHDRGTIVVSGRSPNLYSTKRYNAVVLTSEAALDPERRRRAHRICKRVLRGVSNWFVTRPVSAGVAGPFTIGTSIIGVDSIDTWTYV